MQRSRRALLQRRALEKAAVGKYLFYKASLSLIAISWTVFLFCIVWIGRGDGVVGDALVSPPIGLSSLGDKLGCSQMNYFPGNVYTCPYQFIEDRSSGEALNISARNTSYKFPSQKLKLFRESVPLSESVGFKSNRLSHRAPIGLEEFKNSVLNSKYKSSSDQAGSVVHRVEPGGQKYNYASSSKGAKVLAFNKEAKGASNILGRDKDKYLRNPCSAEEKYVVIELSEETLVDTIEIANFEHHSSNVKDFQLLGSLVYPTEAWTELGNFTAVNGKHAQQFVVKEPKWVRYLKLNLLSHHGSEFYCTLSFLEVNGVDAVERMLADLISEQDNQLAADESGKGKPLPSQIESDLSQDSVDLSAGYTSDSMDIKWDDSKPKGRSLQQVGRVPGDTALKVLMQKVRSLDESLSVFEQYMEFVVNSRYGGILKELDSDLEKKSELIQKIRSDVKMLIDNQEATAEDVDDLISWKGQVSLQLDKLVKDNSNLRSDLIRIQEKQTSMDSKNSVIFVFCLCFGCLAFFRIVVDIMLSFVARVRSQHPSHNSDKGSICSSSWSLLLLSCSITIVILTL